MSELDDFRPRIQNWARIYRDRIGRMQSPLAVVLHNLELLKGDPKAEVDDECAPKDEADANLVECCYARLDASRRKVLKVAYLDARTSETYEECTDLKRAEQRKARLLGLHRTRDYRTFLIDAETALMDRVHAAEEKFGLTKENLQVQNSR